MSSSNSGEPASAPPAATLVVARGVRRGVEVLVLRRTAGSRFAPGFVVFPGGAVEPSDQGLAEAWWGDGADASRACALRELAEETALAVTGGGVVEAGSDRGALDLVGSDPPDAGGIPEIARWIAPDFLPRRFDARFFSTTSGEGLSPRPDGVEIEKAWWARPGEVLRQFPLWEGLMWPTFRMLQAIDRCVGVEEVLGLRVPQEAPPEELVRLRSLARMVGPAIGSGPDEGSPR